MHLIETQMLVVQCLNFYGPSTLHTIQQKLDMLGMVLSQNEIEFICDTLVQDGIVAPATGFNDIAFKIVGSYKG